MKERRRKNYQITRHNENWRQKEMENIVCDAMKAGEHQRVEEEQSWARQSSCAAVSAAPTAAGVFEWVSHYQNAATQPPQVSSVSRLRLSCSLSFFLSISCCIARRAGGRCSRKHLYTLSMLSFCPLSLSIWPSSVAIRTSSTKNQTSKKLRQRRRRRVDKRDGANWHDKPSKKKQQSTQNIRKCYS